MTNPYDPQRPEGNSDQGSNGFDQNPSQAQPSYPNSNTANSVPSSGGLDYGGTPSYDAGTSAPNGAYDGSGAYPGAATYPQYSQQPGLTPEKNGLAGWALGISILALLLTLSVLGIVVSWIFVIAGLVLSIMALKKAKKVHPDFARKGMSVTALILSILSLIALIFIAISLAWGLREVVESGDFESLMECSSLPETEREKCFNDWQVENAPADPAVQP